MFTCKGCRKFRNEWDKQANGLCLSCTRSGTHVTQQPPTQSPYIGTKTKLPCASCEKWIGPQDGQMMKDGTVYCMDCLNTGKWLHSKSANKGRKLVQEDLTNTKIKGRKMGRFGR